MPLKWIYFSKRKKIKLKKMNIRYFFNDDVISIYCTTWDIYLAWLIAQL